MTEHEVIWDGTPARPGGRMLFAPEGTPHTQENARPAFRVLPRGELVRLVRVRASELGEWRTGEEVAAVVGVPWDQIVNLVGTLVRRGEMEREIQRTRGVRGLQRYRWRA